MKLFVNTMQSNFISKVVASQTSSQQSSTIRSYQLSSAYCLVIRSISIFVSSLLEYSTHHPTLNARNAHLISNQLIIWRVLTAALLSIKSGMRSRQVSTYMDLTKKYLCMVGLTKKKQFCIWQFFMDRLDFVESFPLFYIFFENKINSKNIHFF